MRYLIIILSLFIITCGGGGGGSSPTESGGGGSSNPPTGVQILSVVYDLTKMTISWSASSDSNFAKYNLYHSPTIMGDKQIIYTSNDKTVTEYQTTDFNPGLYNWFFIEEENIQGLKTMSVGKSNDIDPKPTQINFNDIDWNGGQLVFSWNKSSDADFKSYTIYKGINDEMYNKSAIWTSTNIDDSSYYYSTDCGSTFYYTIEVEDVWGLKTESNILGADSFYIMKNVFSIGSSSTAVHTPGDIFETDDNGIVIIGKVSGSTGVFFQKLDQYGNRELDQTYGDGYYYGNAGETDDGGYIISAVKRISVSGSTNFDCYLIKIDGNGNIEWSQSYNTEGSPTHDFPHVIQTSDGGYLLASYDTATNDDFYIHKLDGNGQIQWKNIVDGHSMTIAGAPELIYEDNNGLYVVVTTSSTRGVTGSIGDVLKYDSAGNLVSHVGATSGGLRYTGETIRAHDSGYVMGGDGNTKISILKADENNTYLVLVSSPSNFLAVNLGIG